MIADRRGHPEQTITDDLDALLEVLPPRVSAPIYQRSDRSQLLEIVLDLGRAPEARYTTEEVILSQDEVTEADLLYVVSRISAFGDDNRAGIERTLHRISCIRNRTGRIVGLTCRVGRAVFGTIKIIEDLVRSEKSILMLGRPGVGKTTMLREVARVLSDDLRKRVVVVDTSNEIAGDGDIPHPAIGHARRMQVATPSLQHAVMIEAVENHMPQVIIIDEIGTELEAMAARTIAERGVQLVGTAHGNTLDNLIMNPTLSDLVGGVQSVTLSDEEARRRGTQKSILERKAPPTFDAVVEIQQFNQVAIHEDVMRTVDALLRGRTIQPEVRELASGETVLVQQASTGPPVGEAPSRYGDMATRGRSKTKKVFPFGVSRARVEQAVRGAQLPLAVADRLEGADALITSRNYFRRRPQTIRDAEATGVPIYVLKNHTGVQLEQGLMSIVEAQGGHGQVLEAIREAEDASHRMLSEEEGTAVLNPQNAYIRRLQHQVAQRYNLRSSSTGREPLRRVRIYRGDELAEDD